MIKTLLWALIAICTAVPADAFSQGAERVDVKNPTALGVSASNHLQTQDTAALISELKAQNALLKDYQQHLLATVYFSLSFLGIVVALLLGFGWYSNFRVYERDKNALTTDLQLKASETDVSMKIKFESFSKDFLETQQEAFSNKQTELIALGKKAAEEIKDGLQNEMRYLRQEILRANFNIMEWEAQKWKNSGTHPNELSVRIKMLWTAMELNNKYHISDCLAALTSLVAVGTRLHATEFHSLQSALKKLPSDFEIQISTLEKNIRA